MKNLMMLLLVMTVSVLTTTALQAQTKQCTPAEKAACQKICAEKTACTAEQKAACAKACTAKKGTATAAANVNQSPTGTNNADQGTANTSVAKLVGLVELDGKTEQQKKATCNKPCTAKKKE